MLPSAFKLYGDADFILQQDFAPAQCPHQQKYQYLVQTLSPIENVWGNVKRMRSDTRPNNADELKAVIEAT
jgi:hypothetical protein